MKIHHKNHKSKYLFLLFSLVFLTVVLTAYSDISFDSVIVSLKLCASSVVPSLFPFMVLSSIVSKTASHMIRPDSSRLVAIIPFLLGALCGFPVGATSVALLHKNNILSKKKAEYLCALCNNTGPAFIIGVIGKAFWGDFTIGLMFYLCQILSSVIVFTLWYLIFGRRIFNSNDFSANAGFAIESNCSANADFSFCTTFCSSVTESAVSLIHVCGYIVFFKVICDSINILMPTGAVSGITYAILAAILEFTSGAAAAAEIGGIVGIAICGFTIGFSGLSVMAQSAGFLYSSGLSALPLLRLKFFIGIVTATTSVLCYGSFEFSEAILTGISVSYPHDSFKILSLIFLSVFLLVRIFLLMKKLIFNSCH